METVAIVGVGLIGASFGLALRRADFRGRIVGVSSPAALKDARAAGAIDDALPLSEAVPKADLVYLAQPIGRILDTIARLEPLVQPGALVTDAGSTKAEIVSRAARSISRCQFLGGHPMAGKETRGASSADGALFEACTWVVTPLSPAELETDAARSFLSWIRRIGARPFVLDPHTHDTVVAVTSHLAQLVSTALAGVVDRHVGQGENLRVSGTGLAGVIRLASSPYEIWRDILSTNSGPVVESLQAMIDELARIRDLLGVKPSQRPDSQGEEHEILLQSRELEKMFEIGGQLVSRLRQIPQNPCE